MKIQIGYEHKPDGPASKSDIRLTPLDQVLPVSKEIEAILFILFAQLDSRDIQPGDGDVDIPLTKEIMGKLKAAIPVIGNYLPQDGANAFVRLKA